ncbi:siderophore-interacting protein [Marinomonas rhizomae]|uniref:NADPH-dependent ferric siderophore reductase n=1 Tax=Marinomonas rhizomae TaxID=491948 RepID=A0A366J9U1_9GAMM|nr:siderophore-interacting protein [Marinomonas rhizomae]RBP83781.1 NADPH-dependent ferric siderophore reductase [Marinomonas rhizomae]RNF73507.1 siderophore-interacting protein [Marinomonas rhizomae]
MSYLKANVIIEFTDLTRCFTDIVELMAAHNIKLTTKGNVYCLVSAFGTAELKLKQTCLDVSIEASSPASFNRLKTELTGLIEFAAQDEKLDIQWTGDSIGAVLPPDLRVLMVSNVQQITPRIRRVSFGGSNLDRYAVSDQLHCRILFIDKGTKQYQWPMLGDDGRIIWPETGKIATRIFTIRSIDVEAGTLDIDFVMHDGKGPASAWVAEAESGDVVGILGPDAHGPKPAEQYFLAGDETGLPAIARILEALPTTASGCAIIEVNDSCEKQQINAPSGITITWLYRGGAKAGTTTLLIDAFRELSLPENHDLAFYWVGAELSACRAIRNYLRSDMKVPSERMVCFSHWRRGMSEEDIIEAGPSALS